MLGHEEKLIFNYEHILTKLGENIPGNILTLADIYILSTLNELISRRKQIDTPCQIVTQVNNVRSFWAAWSPADTQR